MDRLSMMGPDTNSVKAVGAFMNWIVEWLFGEDDTSAQAKSGYEAVPSALAPDSATKGAPLPVVARNCNMVTIPPESIETRYGSYDTSPWPCYWEGVQETIQTAASEKTPQGPECRKRALPLEAIEYRYSSAARDLMRLPFCMSK